MIKNNQVNNCKYTLSSKYFLFLSNIQTICIQNRLQEYLPGVFYQQKLFVLALFLNER
jgi:hypothetical protein